MTISLACGIIGAARQRLAALLGMTDGGSAILSDSTILGAKQRDGSEGRPVLVTLSGEFDIRYQRVLEDTLSDCLASGRLTLVDLSGVTFVDSRCARELAIYYQLGEGRVVLCDPSREVELSVAACDLDAWIDFIYTTTGDPQGNAAGILQITSTSTGERN